MYVTLSNKLELWRQEISTSNLNYNSKKNEKREQKITFKICFLKMIF